MKRPTEVKMCILIKPTVKSSPKRVYVDIVVVAVMGRGERERKTNEPPHPKNERKEMTTQHTNGGLGKQAKQAVMLIIFCFILPGLCLSLPS